MNSKLNVKKAALFIIGAFMFASFNTVWANDDNSDEKALWTSFEMTKKINRKFKVGAEFEYRTKDYLKDVDRFSAGINLQYKITDWLKATAGHIFIFGYNNSTIKPHFDDFGREDGYNHDHSYWDKRNRLYIALTGEVKIGRVKLSLRERLQYTRTHAEITDEDKHRIEITEKEVYETIDEDYDGDGIIDDTYEMPMIDAAGNPVVNVIRTPLPTVTEKETKKHKNSTVLRSRLTAKYDIPKCKITPFVSVELYSQVNGWKNFEKLRTKVGASYSINKDNAIELYYLREDYEKNGSTDTHVIGVGYSLDL